MFTVYFIIVYCTVGYRQLSSDRGGYRQLSNDRCGVTSAGYEYENGGLYAYDNPTANHNDAVGGVDDPPSFSRSRYRCGGGNPTFTMEPAEPSSTVSHHTQRAPSTSPSLPYLHQRRAGDYSNYFTSDERLSQPHSAETLNRPTTLEVRTLNISIVRFTPLYWGHLIFRKIYLPICGVPQ